MIERHDSPVVTSFVRVLVPISQLFGLYVLVHGHESPGGGFQAGVILAASYIVLALGLGREALDRRVSEPWCLALGALGVLIYALTGVVGVVRGTDAGSAMLPVLPPDAPEARPASAT